MLPADWLYEAYYPWRALKPGVLAANQRQNDAVAQLYPLDLYTRERLAHLEIPLWNPFLGGGLPHLATGFTRALYPPYWLGLPLSAPAARNLEIMLHLVLAGTFQLLYLRSLGCGLTASLLGGIALGWSGPFTVRTPLNYVFDTLAWLPLLLYAAERTLQSRPHGATLLAFGAALQLLAGSLPDVLSSWILITLYVGGRLVLSPSLRSAGLLLRLGAAVLLAAGLAAAQLLPQLELAQLSQRGARTYQQLQATGASLRSLLTLVSPDLAGPDPSRQAPALGPPLTQLYVGAVSLVFIAAAALARRPPAVNAMALAGVGTFLMAAGTPLLALPYFAFPPMAGLRYVHTFANVCAVALATLVGWGAHSLLATPRRSGRWLAAGAALALVAAAALTAISAPVPMALALVWVAGGLGLLAASGAGWLSGRTLALGLVLLSAGDLRRFPARNNAVISPSEYPLYPWTPGLELIRADPQRQRTIGVQPTRSDRSGPWVAGPNLLMAYGIEDAGAYHSLLPARLARYHAVMVQVSEGVPAAQALAPARGFFFVILEHYGFRPTTLARLMNIRYLLFRPSDTPASMEGLRRVHAGEVKVFRYADPLPRAFVAERFEVWSDPERLLARLTDPGFDPRTTVLLEEQPALAAFAEDAGGASSDVQVLTSLPERQRYSVGTHGGGLLVICDSFFPGWRVSVDGSPRPLLQGNYLFRAVAVPPGASTVAMEYAPLSFRVGKWVSVGCLALLCVLAWRARGSTASMARVPESEARLRAKRDSLARSERVGAGGAKSSGARRAPTPRVRRDAPASHLGSWGARR